MWSATRVHLSKLKPLKLHPSTGVYLSPKLGQHLTINPGIIDFMIESADLRSSDHVFEIGPGTGNITSRLLPLVRQVTAVELDSRFFEEVRTRFSGAQNFTAIHGDALMSSWPKFDVLVCNPPYNISSALIFRLAQANFRQAVVLLQREFADRLTADPGEKNFSRLSINARLDLRFEKIKQVSAGSFYPTSSGASTLLKITPRFPKPNVDFREWDAFIRLVFRERKRCLHAVLSKPYVCNMLEHNYKEFCRVNQIVVDCKAFPDLLLEVLEERGLDRVAAMKLKVETLARLLEAFHNKNIFFSKVVASAQSPPAHAVRGSFDAGIPEFFFYDEK